MRRIFVRPATVAVLLAFYSTTAIAGSSSGWSWWDFLQWLWGIIEDVLDDCEDDHEEEVEEITCPCFDTAAIDAELAGLSTEALSWTVRSTGTTDELSLRGYTWEEGSDGLWTSPTTGFDVYRQTDEADAPYCEEWTETWLAAPTHDWAGDYSGSSVALTEDEHSKCREILEDWVNDNSVPLTSW